MPAKPMHAACAMHGRHTPKDWVSVLALPMSFQVSSTPPLNLVTLPSRELDGPMPMPFPVRRQMHVLTINQRCSFGLNHEILRPKRQSSPTNLANHVVTAIRG